MVYCLYFYSLFSHSSHTHTDPLPPSISSPNFSIKSNFHFSVTHSSPFSLRPSLSCFLSTNRSSLIVFKSSTSALTLPLAPPPSASQKMEPPSSRKMESKLQPLDEPLHAHISKPPFFLNPILYFPQPSNSISKPTSNSLPDETNVSSEFHKNSEVFPSAATTKGYEVEVLGFDSQSIVLVPCGNQISTFVLPPPRHHKLSSKLVRVLDLGTKGTKYFQDNVRKTRMTYDALRIFRIVQEEKERGLAPTRQIRCCLSVGFEMRRCGLWICRDKKIAGSIPGVKIGDMFGLHGQIRAGIDFLPMSQSPKGEPIATSIVVSGGYEDNEDDGDVIIYTDRGWHDKYSRQCMHQKLEGGNLALEQSKLYGIEVRVIRCFKYEGRSSGKFYVYDGLYRILDSWHDVGRSGFVVFKFKLVRIPNQPKLGSATLMLSSNLRSNPLLVRLRGYVSFDISRKKDNVPIFLFNDVDDNHEPDLSEYIVTTILPAYVSQQVGNGTRCECVSECLDGCACVLKNRGEFAYDQNGILVRGKPLIFECGPHCCCPRSCHTRVSQQGVGYRFEVFRSRESCWGVRSLELIKAGAFICEYAGVVLTREQAQLFRFNGDNFVYPNRFAERWAEWGDLSHVIFDYKHPEHPSIPPLDFAMDVSRMRNVASYMRHSSSPNVLVQLVLYDHNNLWFPHLVLFALENIPPLRELSLDYGVIDECMGKLPVCN